MAILELKAARGWSLERADRAFATASAIDWSNEHRPRATLGGRTPNEVYFARHSANRKPRFEPRPGWPRVSPCAKPWALVRGRPGAPIELALDFLAGRKQLPIVRVNRVA